MGNFRTVVQRCVEEFSHTKGYILASDLISLQTESEMQCMRHTLFANRGSLNSTVIYQTEKYSMLYACIII